MIETSIDKKLDLKINRYIGSLDVSEIEDAIAGFYRGKPTRNVLWDFTQANIGEIKTNQVEKLASQVSEIGHSREGGKTALVASQDLIFGLSRMFGSLSSSKNHLAEVKVFRSFEEAISWIKGDISA